MSFRNSTLQIIETLKSHDLGPVFAGKPTTANSASSMRNHAFILTALKSTFANTKKVFEVGSGTGHHACIFAEELDHLTWQPSDADQIYKDKINLTLSEASNPRNVLPPVQFDIETNELPSDCDAIYMANVLHCMSATQVEKLIKKAGTSLPLHGLLVAYGPVNILKNKFHTGLNGGEGNRQFDARLKQENPSFGIRNLDDICDYARNVGMTLTKCLWHEATNNWLLVLQKTNMLSEYQANFTEQPAAVNHLNR